jgi:tetratricopeptide (TPR) repeat protein
MYSSRCFRASGGKLGCISCHDPHVKPLGEERFAYYRSRCLTCHQEDSCREALPARRARHGDSCMDCHMPPVPSPDVAHTALSDHRVLRRAGQPDALPLGPHRRFSQEIPLVHFHEDLIDPGDPDIGRDFALALMEIAATASQDPMRTTFGEVALPLLEKALQKAGADAPGWQAKGYALYLSERPKEAMAAFQTALGLQPEREQTLLYAAKLAQLLGRPAEARAYWQRMIAIDPWPPNYHIELAKTFAHDEDWSRAISEFQEALRINPANLEARKLLVGCYARQGDRRQAQAEFERLLALGPPDADQLREGFRKLVR